MCLCRHFTDPAEADRCQQGVQYSALAGGGGHYQVLRLPCVPITNRRGEVASLCDKFEPAEAK